MRSTLNKPFLLLAGLLLGGQAVVAAPSGKNLIAMGKLPEDEIIILRVGASAYDEDIAAADSKKVLGTRAVDINNKLAEDEIIILRVGASAYDEDIAAANPEKVLGAKY